MRGISPSGAFLLTFPLCSHFPVEKRIHEVNANIIYSAKRLVEVCKWKNARGQELFRRILDAKKIPESKIAQCLCWSKSHTSTLHNIPILRYCCLHPHVSPSHMNVRVNRWADKYTECPPVQHTFLLQETRHHISTTSMCIYSCAGHSAYIPCMAFKKHSIKTHANKLKFQTTNYPQQY